MGAGEWVATILQSFKMLQSLLYYIWIFLIVPVSALNTIVMISYGSPM